MPETCVPIRRCGTHAPGWLNGKHPTVAEGAVTRQVCYHWSNKCCMWENNIRVRNCGAFYVYELVKTPTYYLRYCGSDGAGLLETFTGQRGAMGGAIIWGALTRSEHSGSGQTLFKTGLHVRRRHKHKARVNRDDASTSACSFFLRLCWRRTCKPVFGFFVICRTPAAWLYLIFPRRAHTKALSHRRLFVFHFSPKEWRTSWPAMARTATTLAAPKAKNVCRMEASPAGVRKNCFRCSASSARQPCRTSMMTSPA